MRTGEVGKSEGDGRLEAIEAAVGRESEFEVAGVKPETSGVIGRSSARNRGIQSVAHYRHSET